MKLYSYISLFGQKAERGRGRGRCRGSGRVGVGVGAEAGAWAGVGLWYLLTDPEITTAHIK